MSTLQELLAWAEYKQSSAASIREAADAVSSKALTLEIQYDDEVAALTEAIRLQEAEAADPDEHEQQLAELEALASQVSVDIDAEDGEPADADGSDSTDGDAPADEDDDFVPDAATVAKLGRTIESGWTGDESADEEE